MSMISDISVQAPQCPNPFVGGPQLQDVCAASTGPLFLALLNALLISNPKIGDPCGRVTPIKHPSPVYDYIVVGAGASGPVVAAELSNIKKWNVLMVEAGPDEPAGSDVPSYLQLYLGGELDWKYETTNESFACLNTQGKCKWPRGKNLGGNTVHHGMAYHRGQPKDYDNWVAQGNKGWSWKEVLKNYIEMEDNREIGRVDPKYHGTGGPLTVERFRWQPPITSAILDAAAENGFGVREELTGDKMTGFTVAQTISRSGVRLSSVSAYIRPIRDRKNLHVAVNATVTKIRTHKNKATGVELEMNGKKYVVWAKQEVIVAGGSINSPQLLLLSGIGPKEHLRSVNIPVVHDLPGVGENLHNHHSYGIDFTVNERRFFEMNIRSGDQYLYNQTGPMSSTGLAQITGVLPSRFAPADDPDIQIFFAGYQAICSPKLAIADLEGGGNKTIIRITSVNLQPTSRGRLTLKDKNPHSHPIIWSNDLGTPEDRMKIVDGIRIIQKLVNGTALQELGVTSIHRKIPQCSMHTYDSDDYWLCAIIYDTRPENHQTGTCKMGPASDQMAVVDPRLRVHGIPNLRVCDASIMPQVVSGNPVAAIHMIGHRCAKFIIEDHGMARKKQ